jgi:hypothetical protein
MSESFKVSHKIRLVTPASLFDGHDAVNKIHVPYSSLKQTF